jgi:hypothetical protein
LVARVSALAVEQIAVIGVEFQTVWKGQIVELLDEIGSGVSLRR